MAKVTSEVDVPYEMQYQSGGPGWWILLMVAMILFWSLFVFGVVAAIRHLGYVRREGGQPTSHSSVEILRMRFAKGEIDEAEFTSRRALLEDTKE